MSTIIAGSIRIGIMIKVKIRIGYQFMVEGWMMIVVNQFVIRDMVRIDVRIGGGCGVVGR